MYDVVRFENPIPTYVSRHDDMLLQAYIRRQCPGYRQIQVPRGPFADGGYVSATIMTLKYDRRDEFAWFPKPWKSGVLCFGVGLTLLLLTSASVAAVMSGSPISFTNYQDPSDIVCCASGTLHSAAASGCTVRPCRHADRPQAGSGLGRSVGGGGCRPLRAPRVGRSEVLYECCGGGK